MGATDTAEDTDHLYSTVGPDAAAFDRYRETRAADEPDELIIYDLDGRDAWVQSDTYESLEERQ